MAASTLLAGSVAHGDDARTGPGSPPPPGRSGALIAYQPRPVLAQDRRACSFRHPLCVHAAGGRPVVEGEVLAWLDAADRAWDVATGALDLPAPDVPLVGGGALDLYLVDGEPYATRTLLDRRDPRGGFDRASAFAIAGAGGRPGCALDAAAARVIARAILFRVAPATDEGSALAETAYVASLMVPCAPRPDQGLALFQAHPELSLADALPGPDEAVPVGPAVTSRVVTTAGETYASGASLFYRWVDGAYGAAPGAIVRAMWALSPTETPVDAARWNDEPDGFDVLRTSFKGALTTGLSPDHLWLDFAIARAFEPDAPVRVEWSIDWPERPRTLMAGVGVAPTGAAYISVDCRGRPSGAQLRFEATWEEHERMLWSLVRLDATGRELGRMAVVGRERGTSTQGSLVDLDGTARVLVVGASAGDPLVPFDPDDYAWERHGWVVSLASER